MMLTTSPTNDKHVSTVVRLLEVAARCSKDDVQHAIEVIMAVERYAYDTPLVPKRLDRDVGLQSATELLFNAPNRGVGVGGGGRSG